MFKAIRLGLFVVFMSASAAVADPTCPSTSGSWITLTNGNVADASQVMTNFYCLAPQISPTFTGSVLVNTAISGTRLSLGAGMSNSMPFYIYDGGSFVRGIGIDLSQGSYSIGGYETSFFTDDSGSSAGGITLGKMSTDGSFRFTPLMVIRNSGSVGIGTTAPVAGTILDLGSNSSSLLLPVGTTTNRPATGVNGMIRFNSTTGAVEGYSGTSWHSVAPSDNPQFTGNVGIIGAGGTSGYTFTVSGDSGYSSGVGVGIQSAPMWASGSLTTEGVVNNGYFTLTGSSSVPEIVEFQAAPGSVGSATVANYIAFDAAGWLSGSTNNFGVRISGAAGATNFGVYVDSAQSYFGGNVIFNGTIATTNPTTVPVSLYGDIRLGTSGSNGCAQNYGGGVIGGTCSSDASLKEVTGKVYGVLGRLADLQLVRFHWNTIAARVYHKSTAALNAGFIAQDVEKQFPELVTVDPNGYRRLDYSTLSLYGLEAIKELKAANDDQVGNLHHQLDAQAAEIRKLQQRIIAMERRLQIQTAQR